MSERQQNEIFKSQMNTNQVIASPQIGADIATEIVPLPSKGLVYPPEHPLHCVEELYIKPMSSKEEDILTNKIYLKKGTVISELIKSCLVNKNIDPRTMLIGDRTTLLMAIRASGYGVNYEAEVTCPKCDKKSEQVFNLSEIPIKFLELQPAIPGSNLFAFTLPKSKKSVLFKFATGSDEEEAVAIAERQKKLNLQTSNVVTTMLLTAIQSIDGETDKSKIATFCKSMPALDSLELRRFITKHEPGIISRQIFECSDIDCGHTAEVEMPIGVNFLWPSINKR